MASPFKKTKLCPPTKSHSFHSESKENIPSQRKFSDSNVNSNQVRTLSRPLQVLAEVSSNTNPIQIQPTQVLVQSQSKTVQPCTSKSLTQPSTRSKDFCCVYQTSDKKFSIVRVSCVKVPKTESIMIGKSYEISIGKNTVKGVIKFLGKKLECINQCKNLEVYFGPKPVSKRKTISTDSIKSISENVTNEDTNKRIKELEKQIKQKDTMIEQLNEEIRIKKDLIEFYKNNFDSEKVRAIREFCTNFVKSFGSEEDIQQLEEIEQSSADETDYLSVNYKKIRVSQEVKQELEEIVKSSYRAPPAYRKVLMRMIPDINTWAKESLSSALENHSDTIRACFDFVQKTFKDFTFSMVPTILRRITTGSRTKLQKQGYTIVTTYDPVCRRPVYELIKDNDDEDGEDDGEYDDDIEFESEEQRNEFNEVFGDTNLEDVLLNPFGEMPDFKQEFFEYEGAQYEDVESADKSLI